MYHTGSVERVRSAATTAHGRWSTRQQHWATPLNPQRQEAPAELPSSSPSVALSSFGSVQDAGGSRPAARIAMQQSRQHTGDQRARAGASAERRSVPRVALWHRPSW
eukprot:COSAG02_NODE_422_length_22587_cov_10.209089_27_plen_107_part_00